MTLGVFWLKCGSKHGNFGDVLTPLLLDYLNVRYRWAPPDQADLIGIGSICHKVPEDFQGTIWSAGNICEAQYNVFPSARILALRGNLTLRHTKCDQSNLIRLGDGGLLADVIAPRVSKQYRLGVIPHYVDTMDPFYREFLSRNRGTCLVDICEHPRDVIRRVAQCEFILSSSLHGLILADSLGIPNMWIRSRRTLRGGEFKFHDYYSVFNIEIPSPVRLVPTESMDDLLASLTDYRRPGIRQIKDGLWDALSDVVGAKGQSTWKSLAVPTSVRTARVAERMGHVASTDLARATKLRAVIPTLQACDDERKQFIAGCLHALEELWERGVYHRDLRVETVSVVETKPQFSGFDWALPIDAIMPDNPLMNGDRELRRRDLAGLGQVLAAVCGSDDDLMRMVIEIMTKSTTHDVATSLPELRVLMEAASGGTDAAAGNAGSDVTIRRRTVRALLVQLAEMRNQCNTLKRKVRKMSRQLWRSQVEESIAQVCAVIPARDAFILLDKGSWSDFVIPDRTVIPFSERAGEYAGLPVDGQAAVAELKHSSLLGATHMVIPADGWWCLEYYSELSQFLDTSARVVFESPRLRIFRFSHTQQMSSA